MNNKQS